MIDFILGSITFLIVLMVLLFATIGINGTIELCTMIKDYISDLKYKIRG
jgi:hypothetical protein